MTDNAKKIVSLINRLHSLEYSLGRTDAAKHAVTLRSSFAELEDIAEAPGVASTSFIGRL